MIEIVKLNKNYVVIYKPPGIPSQSDRTGDRDAMSLTAEALLTMCEKNSLWLVHRLDRTVGGLLLFARTKSSAAELSEIVREGKMTKRYLAVCEGEVIGGRYRDLLFKDATSGKAYIATTERRGVKEAELIANPIATFSTDSGARTLVDVELITGRFHQIRAQFSHRHTPIVGDGKYGSRDHGTRTPALFAYHLGFTLGERRIEATRLPDAEGYPWSLFREKIKEIENGK